MLRALEPFGGHASHSAVVGRAALGRNLFKSLPEDDEDRQPILCGSGRWWFVGDVRIDNRDEICRIIQHEGELPGIEADSSLFFRAWELFGEDALTLVEGDFAFAAFDVLERTLTLARSPLARKPLFYYQDARTVAFSSMPDGLHALSVVPKSLNFSHAAAMVAQMSDLGSSTMFTGIKKVAHSHVVRLSNNREEIRKYWQPERRIVSDRSLAENGLLLREALERSVRNRLRRHSGSVASQLSSGRDSTAVTTIAAAILDSRKETLVALTGAPSAGFSLPDRIGSIADESEIAARTASSHRNVHHIVCRPPRQHWLPELRRLHKLHWEPLPNPSQLPWWTMVNEGAARAGSTVLLSGSAGNLTISAGGNSHIRDLMVEEGVFSTIGVIGRLAGASMRQWRNLTKNAFGPILSERCFRRVLTLTGRWHDEYISAPLLRQPYRRQVEEILRKEFGDPRPPQSPSDTQARILMESDHPEKCSIAAWSFDQRDPTADRKLIELCLSFPARQLVSGRSARPMYEAAFQKIVSEEVVVGSLRGWQGADWFKHFPASEVHLAFERFKKNAHLQELLDFRAIDSFIDQWPRGSPNDDLVVNRCRGSLLATLAVSDFIELHFPN